MYAIRSYYGTMHLFQKSLSYLPASGRCPVITSYSIHYTKLYDHLFDLARFYFGEAESIVVQTSCSVDGIAGEDMFAALLHMGPTLCVCEIGNHIRNNFV